MPKLFLTTIYVFTVVTVFKRLRRKRHWRKMIGFSSHDETFLQV